MTDPIDTPFLQPLEPTAQQQGVDIPGFYSATTDFINFGVYNGNFRVGPPQAASNLDVATSVTGSNFLPGWRFVQSSNTTITASVVRDSSPGAGSNLRFTAQAGIADGHEAFVEQIIDVGGSAVGDIGGLLRATYRNLPANPSGLEIDLAAQYLNSEGTVAGMPAERRSYAGFGLSPGIITSLDGGTDVDPPPPNARYLRLRVLARSSLASSGNYLDVFDVRRERATVNIRLPDSNRSTNGLYDIRQVGSNLLWQNATESYTSSGSRRILNFQLVPIPFSLVNIPANATTELQMWGDTALALGTPRIGSPWGGSIVGMSYRLSAAPTAGGATALRLQATVAGASVWTAFTLSGTGEPVSGEATQAVGTDEFTAGQQLGVQVVTSGTYAPTTADLAVVLWVAIKYDGA